MQTHSTLNQVLVQSPQTTIHRRYLYQARLIDTTVSSLRPASTLLPLTREHAVETRSSTSTIFAIARLDSSFVCSHLHKHATRMMKERGRMFDDTGVSRPGI